MDLADMYSEVYEILNILGNEYKEKIPKKLYKFIEEERNKNKINNFSVNIPLEEQNISNNTLDFIAYLNMQYWVSKEEKERLLKQYNENDIKTEEEQREKYTPDNIFKDNKKKEEHQNSTEIVVYKENVFIKFKNWLKRLFHI